MTSSVGSGPPRGRFSRFVTRVNKWFHESRRSVREWLGWLLAPVSERVRDWIKDRFYSNSRDRTFVFLVFIPGVLVLLYWSYYGWRTNGPARPASALVAVLCAELLVVFLSVDSFSYIMSLLVASLHMRVIIIRKIDSILDQVIARAEERVEHANEEGSNLMQTAELRALADDFLSDFGNRRPFPRLAKSLLFRTGSNFLVTIGAFAIMTSGIALRYAFAGDTQSPLRHFCLDQRGFGATLLHSFYYHVVIFQSLGDPNHAPDTLFVQVMAIVEAFLSFFYTILIFGGVLSVSMFVQSEMTPEKLSNELFERLKSLSSEPETMEGANPSS